MKLQFLSPNKTIFDGDIESVTIPGTKGSFTVWDNHAPLLTSMASGTVLFQINDKDVQEIGVSGGFAEVKDNTVTICTEKVIDTEDKE